MANVEYDLDTKGGLMSKIYELIAPPRTEESKSKKKEKKGLKLHPYFRKPGKGHNRDFCDACEEGGNLLCCDRCPASFHFICVNPPIDEDKDIPMGEWICNKCSYEVKNQKGTENIFVPAKRKSRSASSSSKKEGSEENVSVKGKTSSRSNDILGTVNIPLNERGLRSCNDKKRSSTSEVSNNPTEIQTPVAANKISREKEKKRQPSSCLTITRQLRNREVEDDTADHGTYLKDAFEILVDSAARENPKEFALPPELQSSFPFPGTDKVISIKGIGSNRRPSVSKKKPYELDSNGNVPLPAKCCFVCNKSCRFRPLISCDYCPLLFHLDCLNPPLTSKPDRNWICPNHVEPVMEKHLLKNDSYTERVNLWEKYSIKPIDHHTVKLDFFKRAAKDRLYNKFFIKSAPKHHAMVPDSIRSAYANPSPLMPSLQEMLRLKTALKLDDECCSHCPLSEGEKILTIEGENLGKSEQEKNTGEELENEDNHEEMQIENSVDVEMHVVDNVDIQTTDTADSKVSLSDQELFCSAIPEMQHELATRFGASSVEELVVNNTNLEIDKTSVYNKVDGRPESYCSQFVSVETEVEGIADHLNSSCTIPKTEDMYLPSTSKYRNTPSTAISINRQQIESKESANRFVHWDENTFTISSSKSSNDTALTAHRTIHTLKQAKSNTCSDHNKYTVSCENKSKQTEKTSETNNDILMKLQLYEEQVLENIRKFDNEAGDMSPFLYKSLNIRKAWPKLHDQVKLLKNKLPKGVYAMLIPINYHYNGALLPLSRLNPSKIGTDSSCDVNLAEYRYCDFVDDFHATLYFNSLLNRYELLNYSRYGSVVNGRRFGIDPSAKSEEKITKSQRQPSSQATKLKNTILKDFLAADQAFLNKQDDSSNCPLNDQQNTEGDSDNPDNKRVLCDCKPLNKLIAGWEGPADVVHGTHLQFGCIQFVFCLAERRKADSKK